MKDKPTFAELLHDARFEVVGLLKLKEGEYAQCVFCGCRIKYPVLLKRNDGTFWKVSRYCIGKVGLELTGKEETVYRKGEQPKVEEDEENYFSLDDVFED